jgi:mannose-1-phosphate guanylyltransferase
MKIFAVLMAGGVGTRFWPRSRSSSPKQVLNIINHESLIQGTFRRLQGVIEPSQLFVITNTIQKRIIKTQIPQLENDNFIIEPFGRNTAPCIGLAAIHILQEVSDAIMLVLPADHLIADVDEFKRIIGKAINFVSEKDGLITLGINPSYPATGYGYIQQGAKVKEEDKYGLYKVKTFAEKPNYETAVRFLESGDFYWNSGIFIWKLSTILHEIETQLPELYEGLLEIKKHMDKPDLSTTITKVYRRIRNISIDYGVMQSSRNVYVIPSNMGWNDVGSWEVIHKISKKDKHKNAGEFKDLIQYESRDNYVYAPRKLVALVGVRDLVVVHTKDAILISKKSKSQDVKEIVEQLKKSGKDEYL